MPRSNHNPIGIAGNDLEEQKALAAARRWTRVRLTCDVDRYPHFVAPKGATGTVKSVEEDLITVLNRLVGLGRLGADTFTRKRAGIHLAFGGGAA
jgi:hypothetical protein